MMTLHSLQDALATFGVAALGLMIPVSIALLWFRRQRERRRLAALPQDHEPLVGTSEDLRRAEAEVKNQPFDVREALLETHVLIKRFPTLQGFSRTYMDGLATELEAVGIAAIVRFQETLPMGYASITEPQGVFELYVPLEDESKAVAFLKQRIPSKA